MLTFHVISLLSPGVAGNGPTTAVSSGEAAESRLTASALTEVPSALPQLMQLVRREPAFGGIKIEDCFPTRRTSHPEKD